MNISSDIEVQTRIARAHKLRAQAFRNLFHWKIFAARPARVVTA